MATFFSLQPCVHSSFGTAFGRPRLKAVQTLWVRSRKNAKPARNVAEAEAEADADADAAVVIAAVVTGTVEIETGAVIAVKPKPAEARARKEAAMVVVVAGLALPFVQRKWEMTYHLGPSRPTIPLGGDEATWSALGLLAESSKAPNVANAGLAAGVAAVSE